MISLEHRAAALRKKIEAFAPLPDLEWKYLVGQLTARTLAAGEFFVREGESGTQVGFIESGLVKDCYLSEDGKEYVKEFEGEGCFVGPYSALLTDRVARFSTVALEPTSLLVMPLNTMEDLYARHACWDRFGRRLAEYLFLERERRERELLIEDASERLASFLECYGALAERIPQKEIAAYLGITPVSLSRLRAQRRN